jgi:hypothetical protein
MDEDELFDVFRASPRMLQTVDLGDCPIFTRVGEFSKEPSPGVPSAVLARRAQTIAGDADFQARVAGVMDRIVGSAPTHFVSPSDTALCELFHETPWSERRTILDQIADPQLRQFGQRLIAAEAPDSLSEIERREYVTWQAERVMHDNDAAWMPEPDALKRLVTLIKANRPADRARLERHLLALGRVRTTGVQFPHAVKKRRL